MSRKKANMVVRLIKRAHMSVLIFYMSFSKTSYRCSHSAIAMMTLATRIGPQLPVLQSKLVSSSIKFVVLICMNFSATTVTVWPLEELVTVPMQTQVCWLNVQQIKGEAATLAKVRSTLPIFAKISFQHPMALSRKSTKEVVLQFLILENTNVKILERMDRLERQKKC